MTVAEPDSQTKRRLFFAVWPSSDVLAELDEQLAPVRRASADWIRWQPLQRLHITLLFLGDCDPERAQWAETVGRRVVAGGAAVELRIHGAGRFGQVAWLGVVGPWLVPVHEDLRRLMRVAPERRAYRPHITVARSRPRRSGTVPDSAQPTVADTVATLRQIQTETWVPGHLDLVASTLGPAPTYQVVKSFPWGTAS